MSTKESLPQHATYEIHPNWEGLAPNLRAQADELLQAAARDCPDFLPSRNLVLAALSMDPARARVLILGQDPYPTPGHPVGLSFSAHAQVWPRPRSLDNIYAELASNYPEHREYIRQASPDLSGWAEQGVLLLNTTLTVRPGQPQSQAHLGWSQLTSRVIEAMKLRATANGRALVSLEWGRHAQNACSVLGAGNPLICRIQSPHPSPLSAHRGFFGSRPFLRANEHLVSRGATPIDWVGGLRPRPANPANP